MQQKISLGSAVSRDCWSTKVKEWLERMGDMVGMIIKGNEAADVMAASALTIPNQAWYAKLEEEGCHLY